ncbi:MAG: transposase [Thermoanaerobaculia bacterium]|nr:transposase [Thermoanaerobaculia bacterium]MBP7813852.1 transposase [Thermoanaerobaculia bacterium]MBP8844456.1 transposase [Thermoanaerobaculia bacterium]MDI9630464.1 transposase [Acidobacteriota bacterium]HRU08996.1 transposase [Thermoanaerobaculia bacterium]
MSRLTSGESTGSRRCKSHGTLLAHPSRRKSHGTFRKVPAVFHGGTMEVPGDLSWHRQVQRPFLVFGGMGRRLRYTPPGGALFEVTCGTFQRRLLLRPSPQLRAITLGVLARAQEQSGIAIHAFVFLSNHYHLLVTTTDAAQLAQFVGYLNSNLAREVARLHGWEGKVWARRYEAILVSDEDSAQVERLLYLVRQGCKEGLVDDPLEWPGATSWQAMLSGDPPTGIWFDRTSECHHRRNGAPSSEHDFAIPQTVTLTPLPAWADLSAAERRARLEDLLDLARTEARSRRKETGRRAIGPKAVQRLDPLSIPIDSRRRPAPLVHATSREVRLAFLEAYRLFTAAYRRAADALRAGFAAVVFPDGCFPPPGPFRKPAIA